MYTYEHVRPKLWEVHDKGRAVGRIRHVFSPGEEERVGWMASNGVFYERAKDAVKALIAERKLQLRRA